MSPCLSFPAIQHPVVLCVTLCVCVCGCVVVCGCVRQVMKYEHWDGKLLPDFHVGQVFRPSSLLLRESVTHAPPLLSEADLIAIMDENGIGTDATIAEHISAVQQRKCVRVPPFA